MPKKLFTLVNSCLMAPQKKAKIKYILSSSQRIHYLIDQLHVVIPIHNIKSHIVAYTKQSSQTCVPELPDIKRLFFIVPPEFEDGFQVISFAEAEIRKVEYIGKWTPRVSD
jgi:hypothetical protein